jgi:hypothetical protein
MSFCFFVRVCSSTHTPPSTLNKTPVTRRRRSAVLSSVTAAPSAARAACTRAHEWPGARQWRSLRDASRARAARPRRPCHPRCRTRSRTRAERLRRRRLRRRSAARGRAQGQRRASSPRPQGARRCRTARSARRSCRRTGRRAWWAPRCVRFSRDAARPLLCGVSLDPGWGLGRVAAVVDATPVCVSQSQQLSASAKSAAPVLYCPGCKARRATPRGARLTACLWHVFRVTQRCATDAAHTACAASRAPPAARAPQEVAPTSSAHKRGAAATAAVAVTPAVGVRPRPPPHTHTPSATLVCTLV